MTIKKISQQTASSVLETLKTPEIQYGDVRLVHLKQRVVSAKNGRPSVMDQKESVGMGIRVLRNGAWGFASTPDLSGRGIERAVKKAGDTAGASARLRKTPIRLISAPPVQAYWKTEIRIDPWQIELDEQMDYLMECEAILRKDRRIRLSESRMEFTRKEQVFASTEGSLIQSVRYMTGGGLYCKAMNTHEVQKRSFPSPSRDFRSQGYEFIQELGMRENAERVREEALRLLKSPSCPSGTFDLVLRDSILALQIHESIGHAAELDRVYGYEDNLGGRTYLTPEKCGRLRVGSACVTLVANRPRDREGVGTIVYDDEGVEAKETMIVEKGLFRGYLSSRETAHFLSREKRSAAAGSPQSFGESSPPKRRRIRPSFLADVRTSPPSSVADTAASGSMIAEDGSFFPIIRMTNLSLLAGSVPFEELLGEVKEGLLLDTESSWSIDEERGDFQIGGEIAWRIRRGKIVGAYKNPLYRGQSLSFWKKCAVVADDASYRITGFADCGKGGPYQQAFVSHGSSPALFRGVECYSS